MSPLPGVMGAGRILDDDEALPPDAADDDDGLNGDISVWISASVIVGPDAGQLLFKAS